MLGNGIQRFFESDSIQNKSFFFREMLKESIVKRKQRLMQNILFEKNYKPRLQNKYKMKSFFNHTHTYHIHFDSLCSKSLYEKTFFML